MRELGSWPYSHDYAPPAPIIEIGLKGYVKMKVKAFIDSGADITIIARRKASEASLAKKPPISAIYLKGPDYAGMAPIIHLSMEIGKRSLEVAAAVAEIENEAILGRDILNQLRIVLEGPSETTTIYADE